MRLILIFYSTYSENNLALRLPRDMGSHDAETDINLIMAIQRFIWLNMQMLAVNLKYFSCIKSWVLVMPQCIFLDHSR